MKVCADGYSGSIMSGDRLGQLQVLVLHDDNFNIILAGAKSKKSRREVVVARKDDHGLKAIPQDGK